MLPCKVSLSFLKYCVIYINSLLPHCTMKSWLWCSNFFSVINWHNDIFIQVNQVIILLTIKWVISLSRYVFCLFFCFFLVHADWLMPDWQLIMINIANARIFAGTWRILMQGPGKDLEDLWKILQGLWGNGWRSSKILIRIHKDLNEDL